MKRACLLQLFPTVLSRDGDEHRNISLAMNAEGSPLTSWLPELVAHAVLLSSFQMTSNPRHANCVHAQLSTERTDGLKERRVTLSVRRARVQITWKWVSDCVCWSGDRCAAVVGSDSATCLQDEADGRHKALRALTR